MMRRILCACATLGVVLALASAGVHADPSIGSITPSITSANTGASVIITGTGFGNYDDKVFFPGTNNFVYPSLASSGSLTVTVPPTWSGNVQVQTHGAGNLSNGVLHDISYSTDTHFWGSLPVHWALNNAPSGVTFANAQGAIAAALNTWACASNFSTTYDGSTVNTATNFDGVNAMSFNSSGWGNPNTIAVTTWWWYTTPGPRVEADIAFNSQNFTWNVNGSSSDMDIQNIATHETGHFHWALDLYGADDTEKTMYGFASNGEVKRQTLTEYDVEGAENAYPHSGRADLDQNATPSGWYLPLTPRVTNDATLSFAPLPGTLPGGGTTYINAAMTNDGLDCAAPSSLNNFYVDDNFAYWFSWGGVWGAGATYGLWTNWPLTVQGGRHTLRIDDDVNGEIQESNESNNTYQAQYVWSPLVLATDTPVYRGAAPDNGPFVAPNSDGFQYLGDWWGGVGMIPVYSNDDYDVREYNDYANSTTGFASATAYSPYGQGATDFVIWNGNVVGFGATRWAGVTAFSYGAGGGDYVEATNRYANTALVPGNVYGTSVSTGTVSVAAYDILKVHELFLAANTTYTIQMTNLSGSADLNINLVGGGTGMYARSDYLATSQNFGGGTNETITYTTGGSGAWYGVVVYKRGSGDLGLANTYQLTVGPTLTDLVATTTPGGFDWPSVPRNDNTAGLGNAHVTATLDGNTGDTYVSNAIQQVSPNANTPAFYFHLNVDIDNYVWWWYVGTNANTNISWQGVNGGPFTIPGGRHSLSNLADPDALVAESDEGNNSWIGQWIWSPLGVTVATPEVRGAPPNPGWFYFSEPNADGMTFTRNISNAWVAGVAPLTAGDDYDLIVYSDYASSTNGYSSRLGYSAFGGTSTDFVVGSYTGTPTTLYPAAVRFSTSGGGGAYAGDQNDSFNRFSSSATVQYGGQVMGSYRVVDVFEGYFAMGAQEKIKLLSSAGPDLAFEVFPSASGSYGRGSGTASSPTSSNVDALTFSAPASGWYPIVVYKTNGTTAGTSATYTLQWTSSVTGVAPTARADLALDTPSPNPFSSVSRMSFSLAESGPVTVAVFDIGGRRVRQLASGEYGAGPHPLVWDATADDGTRVRNGLYWVRMEAAGHTFTQRLTLLR
jgi:FlgD Ig-like domain/IPT/TIG domain/CARDB